MAVLPTPASPTSSGLFLRRRQRICTTRSSSASRPMSGSILPSTASWFRFCVKLSSAPPACASGASVSASPSSREPGRLRRLGDAVRDVVHDVEARDALLVQEVDRVRVLLAVDRHQHVGAGHLLLAGRLHVQDRALDHALEAQRGLRVDLAGAGDGRRVLHHEVRERLLQLVDLGGAGLQHLGGGRVVAEREQQVLHGDEFVALLPGLDEGHVQADFQLLGDHVSSIAHCSGCWCSREYAVTCSTLLEATSLG